MSFIPGFMQAAQAAGSLIPPLSTSSPAFSRSAADAYQAGVMAQPTTVLGSDMTILGGGSSGSGVNTPAGAFQAGIGGVTGTSSAPMGGLNITTLVILAGVGIAAWYLLKKG